MRNPFYLFAFALSILMQPVYSTSEIDSLKHIINKSSGKEKIDLLNKSAIDIVYQDPGQSLEFATRRACRKS
jgi:archaellin